MYKRNHEVILKNNGDTDRFLSSDRHQNPTTYSINADEFFCSGAQSRTLPLQQPSPPV